MAYGWCFTCSTRHLLRLPRLQLVLGASEDGKLIPVRDAQRALKTIIDKSNTSLLSKPPITNLPDELLHAIFSIAVVCDPWRPDEYYTCALALSTVCKSFHRIVQPLLFKNIQFSFHSLVPACTPVIRFHRTIKANQALGTFCKSVRFHIPNLFPNGMPEKYMLAEELLTWLPNVTSFYLNGGFYHSPTWPLIKLALFHMPHIKDLTFCRGMWDLYLDPVCDIIQRVVQLQSLALHGISPQENRGIWSLDSKNKELEHTSTITKLEVSGFGEAPEALHNLLKLPKALEHFRFGKFHSDHENWDLSLFQSILHDHRTSLKCIEIGTLGKEMKTINLLDFPNLETLNLSRSAFDFNPKIASSTLLAPKLHTFIWDYMVVDQHSELWTDFGHEQKDWILKFAQLSIARKSALRKIEVVFTPDVWSDDSITREELRDWNFPWDLMDEIRDALRDTCVDFSYHKSWSEEYLQSVEMLHEGRP